MGVQHERGEQLALEKKPLIRTLPVGPAGTRNAQNVDLLFAVGGWNASGDVSCVECYNPLLHGWKVNSPVPMKRCGLGVTTLNNFIYVVGGFDGILHLSSVIRYDAKTNEWQRDVASLNEGKRDMGVAELGDFLYSVGGHDGITCLNTVERYDLSKNEWCKMAPMNIRRTALGVVAINGYLYAIGGSNGKSPLNSVERYSPEENSWSLCPALGTCRENFGCAVFQGKIYVVGGRDSIMEHCSAERFDPLTNWWSPMVPMKSKRNKTLHRYAAATSRRWSWCCEAGNL
uniref:Kelch-like protein 20 isoform X3 n=1 Tax=Geotrypetes seraphini TaxID=260995 RepID=A0A6P8SMH0_GEOSA|nr:kelch-like protein 20 isoform X3 [Geotrypetes seraphini]